MKIGMNLLLWTSHVTEEHRGVLEMLKKQGYDGVEIPIFEMDPTHYAKVGKWCEELGLERTAVTCRGTDDNPISPDKAVRAAGVANNKKVLDCCQAMNAKILAGPFHSALGYFTGTGPTADEQAWGVDSMRQVAEHAAKTGVTLAVEYLNRFECYFLTNAVDTAKFIDTVNHPNCRMMYDTFHANIEETGIRQAIHACAKQTVHVHISENHRGTPGQGHVAWAESFDALNETKYDGWMTIEAFGLALPALAAATKIWRKMFESEEQLSRDGLKFVRDNLARRV